MHDRAVAVSVLGALGISHAELAPIGGGLSSEAWLVRDDDARTVLRIASHPQDPITYPSEHAVMAALHVAGATVPRPVIGSWQVDGWQGPAFSVTTWLPGTSLRSGARRWADEPIADFLRILHRLPVTGDGPIAAVDGRLGGTCDEPEAGAIEAWSGAPLWPLGGSRLDRHPALKDLPRLVRSIEQHGPAVREAILTGDSVLVHADLHEENILQDGRHLGFIDFGVAFVGVPAWEFAALAYFLDWELADRTLSHYLRARVEFGVPTDVDEWNRSIALVALSLGARRWEQDREHDLDEDPHNLAFLRTAMERLET